MLTDLDFADDIALLSEELRQAQELLHQVETSVAKVGLKMNASKTKFMAFNQIQECNIQTNDSEFGHIIQFYFDGSLKFMWFLVLFWLQAYIMFTKYVFMSTK